MTNPFAPGYTPPAPTASPAANPWGQAEVTSAAHMPSAPAPATDPFAGSGSSGVDEFGAPAPQGDRARVRDCAGRLLLIMPKKLEVVPNRLSKEPGATQDRLTADIVILDGGPIAYGGNPEARQDPRPHNKQHEVPWSMTGSYISNKGLVSQCRDALAEYRRVQAGQPAQGPTMILGRLYQGPATTNPEGPWLLRPPTAEEAHLARQWLAANPRDPFAA